MRSGTAEPLGLCNAPTETLGNKSGYSHSLSQRYEDFLNYEHFIQRNLNRRGKDV